MLETLKEAVRERFAEDIIFEGVNAIPDEVKDDFEDPDMGDVEDDASLQTLIEQIPEDGEVDLSDATEEELENVVEAFLPDVD